LGLFLVVTLLGLGGLWVMELEMVVSAFLSLSETGWGDVIFVKWTRHERVSTGKTFLRDLETW
jgi:hypothetical protein